MSTLFKPMLASPAELDKLIFPLLASPKLDGVRAVVRDGVVYSRSNKPIPNKWVQRNLAHLEHFDGELIVGDPCSKTVYRDTVSEVMSIDKENGAAFYAFDHVQRPQLPYLQRHELLHAPSHVVMVPQHHVCCLKTLLELEEKLLDEGYEGLILRSTHGHYKFGRSTTKEGLLLKLKRFEDSEAEIIGIEEEMHNANVAKTNELGRTARSSAKAGKVGKGTMGAIVVRDIHHGWEFNIGTGFTADDRAAEWVIGTIVKYKFFPVGMKDVPRHPVFLGIRSKEDM